MELSLDGNTASISSSMTDGIEKNRCDGCNECLDGVDEVDGVNGVDGSSRLPHPCRVCPDMSCSKSTSSVNKLLDGGKDGISHTR